jgi:ribosomal-protein-alanine N-acetyltransferase
MEPLQTRSLSLDPLTREDYAWLCGLYADPGIMRYIGSGVRSEETCHKTLDAALAQGARLGYGYWVVRERATSARVGGAMLMIRREGSPVELGFLFAREAWGRGFATEVSLALLEHAFGTLRIPEIQAFTDTANVASMAVLRKAGFSDDGLCTGPYGGTDRRFSIARDRWRGAADPVLG